MVLHHVPRLQRLKHYQPEAVDKLPAQLMAEILALIGYLAVDDGYLLTRSLSPVATTLTAGQRLLLAGKFSQRLNNLQE